MVGGLVQVQVLELELVLWALLRRLSRAETGRDGTGWNGTDRNDLPAYPESESCYPARFRRKKEKNIVKHVLHAIMYMRYCMRMNSDTRVFSCVQCSALK